MLRAARCFQCDRETRTKCLGKRQSHKEWANTQMCLENGIRHHHFNSFSLPPTIPQFTLLVICESQNAWHCVPWHSPPQIGMVSARTTQTLVSQLSACWVVSTTQPTFKKGMNKCHGNLKKLLNPDRQKEYTED